MFPPEVLGKQIASFSCEQSSGWWFSSKTNMSLKPPKQPPWSQKEFATLRYLNFGSIFWVPEGRRLNTSNLHELPQVIHTILSPDMKIY